MLRGPEFQRIFPDVYAPAELTADLRTRSLAAHVWLNGEGVLAGYPAAELYYAPCAPAETPVEVIIPGRARRAPRGMIVRRDLLADDEHRRHKGTALTTPVRTAFDLARRNPLVEGVAAMDSLAGRFGFKPQEVLETAVRHPRARGLRRLADVVAYAEPLAESPMESRLRMLLVLGGLPKPTAQYTVPDERGRQLATIDLAYPDRRIAIEYEGEEHFERQRVVRDVGRGTRLTALGWRLFRYVASDIYRTPNRTIGEVRATLQAPNAA